MDRNHLATALFGMIVIVSCVFVAAGTIEIAHLPTTTNTAAVSDFNSNLILHYTLDDGTATDASGKGNNGTVSGGTTVSGKIGSARSFASGGSVSTSKHIFDAYPATMCAWVNPQLKSNGSQSKIVGNTGFDLLMIESDGQEKFSVYNNSKDTTTPYGTRYAAGSWHHVCGVVDAGAMASIYVNGVRAVGPTSIGNAAAFWNLGTGSSFSGSIDELRIYNRDLTSSEIADIYSYSGSGGDVGGGGGTTPQPTNGSCSTTLDQCTNGIFADDADTTTDYKWFCNGENGGTNASCSLPKAPIPENGQCSAALDQCTKGTYVDDTDTSTDYKWLCNGKDGGTNATCSLPKTPASTELFPPERMYDWASHVGVPGGIPARTTICANVKNAPYNAVGDGVADDTVAITSALKACAGKNEVVYLPEGTYKFTEKVVDTSTGRMSVNFSYSNITLRGAGMGKTVLKPYTSNAITVGYDDWPTKDTPTVAVTGGATRGSYTVNVADSSSVAVNRVVLLSQLNPDWVHYNSRFYGEGPVDDGHKKDRLMAIAMKVASKTPTSITFVHPLPIDMTNSPMITPWNNVFSGFGFEDLTFDMSSSNARAGIFWLQVHSCWMKGIEIKRPANRFLWFQNSSNCEVRDSYFHDARTPKIEGIDFYQNATFNLMENNILVRSGSPMIMLGDFGGGSSMNVIAYNYLEDQQPWSDVSPYAISDNHGAHNMFNLIEGNVAQNIASDGYFGGASHTTYFRNHFTSLYGKAPGKTYDFLWQYAIHLGHWSVKYSVIGNVLGTPGYFTAYQPTAKNYPGATKAVYRIGFPDVGNSGYTGTGSNPTDSLYYDTNVEATLIRHGNFDYFNNQVIWSPSISTRSLPASLYLSGRPSWWNTWGSTPYPPIGPDVSGYVSKLPAQLRYEMILNGGDLPPPGSLTCTSFTYSAWGACTSGTQSRTVLTSSPSGCTGGTPVLTQSCSPTTLTADFNSDGRVNSLDFSALQSRWNQPSTIHDLNKDGIVNTLDYSILIQQWTG